MEQKEDDFDYYDILNVTRESSLEDIKASYHKLIRQWHPDKSVLTRSDGTPRPVPLSYRNNQGDDASQENQRDSAFNKIHLAYTVLSDPHQRELYDKYGAEGVKLEKLVKKQMLMETTESYKIEEVILNEDVIRENEEMRKMEEEAEVERRIHKILQKRTRERLKESPVQIITRFTFAGVTHVFDDKISAHMRQRYFHLNRLAVENSAEIALSKNTRLGYSNVTSISRSSFGASRGGIYLSYQVTDTLMSTVNLDCGNYLNYNSTSLSVKKMFSDQFWATSILSVDKYLTPSMRCIVHKSWADRHAVELSSFPQYVMTYGYNREFSEDLKVNIQTALTKEDIGTLLRVKAMSTVDSVVGATCRYSMNGGLTLDGYIRQRFVTDVFAKMKLECRLRFRLNSLQLILKMIMNNTRIDLPIDLYTGSVDYCVFLGTVATCTMMMVPLAVEMLQKMLTLQQPALKQEPILKNMRSSFYSNFPLFSFYGFGLDESRKHEKYVDDFGKSAGLMKKTAIWSEEMLESIVARDVYLAQQEGNSIFNNASGNYHKEADVDGLCILFAVYGHPEVITMLDEFITMDIFQNITPTASNAASPNSKDVNLSTVGNFQYGTVTVESILKQNNQTRLEKLFARYVIDVTNALMSRAVLNSTQQETINRFCGSMCQHIPC
ncbi:hypothetical protein BgAZ_108170 [Babesia gibsoni]|uniref:J domain-containing protein n=1 Tax=Babesia gibsoni TaxID=33632 RepID=A0AAD8UTX0_BABGI|nr:hypothetical protein BgAZ_108170 [Babesia gibsoni]